MLYIKVTVSAKYNLTYETVKRKWNVSRTSCVRCFSDPPIALSDRKTCAPDPPTPASTDACVPAPTAEEGVYVEIEGTENTYDKLHPYSNQDAESQ